MADHSFTNFNINQEKKAKIPGKPRVLIAPLDWGLGHATRCIPIIRELQQQGCDVWLAGEGAIETLLKNELEGIPVLKLRGYRVKYAGSAKGFFWRIFSQLPKIRAAISYENGWLKEQVKDYDFDAVIADNRFGLYYQSIPCVFVTHQLSIKSPLGKWNEKLIRRWNYSYINHFSACWVPDSGSEFSLAGELSHPPHLPAIPVHYIGPLSRLKKENGEEHKGHITILLSGPEPQRSILEDKLIDELVKYRGTADIIRGLPSSDILLPSTNQIRFFNHLPADEINKKLARSEFVISRSGYSTVMDLLCLHKKGILIPTPGQTEQEYLAAHLMNNKIAYCISQNEFSLNEALRNARQFTYRLPEKVENNLRETVGNFVAELRKKDQYPQDLG